MKKIQIPVPDEVNRALKVIATADDRSLTREIVAILTHYTRGNLRLTLNEKSESSPTILPDFRLQALIKGIELEKKGYRGREEIDD